MNLIQKFQWLLRQVKCLIKKVDALEENSSSNITRTSQLINDGEDGTNSFLSLLPFNSRVLPNEQLLRGSRFDFIPPTIDTQIPLTETIVSVDASYFAQVPKGIEMVVESIDDLINVGRKALRILFIENEDGDTFSLSGEMEQFSNVSGIVQTKTFNFDGVTPEILIDNIDPALPFSAMRFVNTQESDLTCINLEDNLEINTFGTSTVFNNTFVYSEYINNGNTTITREGNYISNDIRRYLVPKSNIVINNIDNTIYLDDDEYFPDSVPLPNIYTILLENRVYDIVINSII